MERDEREVDRLTLFFVKRNPWEVQGRGKEVGGEETETREVWRAGGTELLGHRGQGGAASGLTPRLLPWAAGSGGLLFLELGDARWWWVCEEKMMNLILDVSCWCTGDSWTYGMAPNRTPCNGFHTSSLYLSRAL